MRQISLLSCPARNYYGVSYPSAQPCGRTVQGVVILSVSCWSCGFELRQGHGCLSVVTCELSGRGLCVGLITRPEESYRLLCVVVWDLETSGMRP